MGSIWAVLAALNTDGGGTGEGIKVSASEEAAESWGGWALRALLTVTVGIGGEGGAGVDGGGCAGAAHG